VSPKLIYNIGATQPEADEEISWDADSDDEEPDPSSPPSTAHKITLTSNEDTASTTTISPQPPAGTDSAPSKSAEGRKSNDQHSQPDSDASYDLVSGATSRTPGSPREDKEKLMMKNGKKDEESDEEDWE
jgi:hypothetical protein